MNELASALHNRDHERAKAEKAVAEYVAEIYRLEHRRMEINQSETYTEADILLADGIKTKIEEMQRSIGHHIYWAVVMGAANFHFSVPDTSVYPAYLDVKERKE